MHGTVLFLLFTPHIQQVAAAVDEISGRLKMAECPIDYHNDGRKCVRDRREVDPITRPAKCPSGYQLKGSFCKKPGLPMKSPTCPSGLYRFMKMCYGPCPDGYFSTKKQGRRKCVLPKDSLSSNYMTCDGPNELRTGANCIPSVQCLVHGVPGTFYYHKGKCVRGGHALFRKSVPVPSGDVCPENKVRVGKHCQDPCPEGYMKRKGLCELRKCVLPGSVKGEVKPAICPEGTYAIPWSQI